MMFVKCARVLRLKTLFLFFKRIQIIFICWKIRIFYSKIFFIFLCVFIVLFRNKFQKIIILMISTNKKKYD